MYVQNMCVERRDGARTRVLYAFIYSSVVVTRKTKKTMDLETDRVTLGRTISGRWLTFVCKIWALDATKQGTKEWSSVLGR